MTQGARICGVIAAALSLCGCATQTSGGMNYARVDGAPVNESQMRAVLAQCQAEAAKSVSDYVTGEGAIPWAAGMMSRSSKEATITKGCMARNGYLSL
jgi:hypothetical protein